MRVSVAGMQFLVLSHSCWAVIAYVMASFTVNGGPLGQCLVRIASIETCVILSCSVLHTVFGWGQVCAGSRTIAAPRQRVLHCTQRCAALR